jgi:hypothetical protein
VAKKLNWIVPIGSIAATLAVIFVLWVVLFAPQKGTLELHCQRNIQLFVDGQDYGQGNDFQMQLPVGNHEYTGIVKGQGDWNMKISGTFNIEKGKTTPVICGEDPEIEFTSDPSGAKVTIQADNNPEIGVTPVTSKLPPGTYTFVFILNGKVRLEGPVKIDFDDIKKVDAYFGKQPKKGADSNDKMVITSLPEGLKIYKDKILEGITPVSFESTAGYLAGLEDKYLPIPAIYPKQFVWLRHNGGLNMAISRANIEYSEHTWFTNGGFFKSHIENGFLKIIHTEDQPIQIKLPRHEKILCLDLHGNTIRFAGADGQKLIMLGFDAISGKQTEILNRDDFASGFTKQLQSQDGSVSKFFVVYAGKLCEVDVMNMKLIELGNCPSGVILRRFGETTDFCIGILSADGYCHGIISQRFTWIPDKPMKLSSIAGSQPAILCFHSDESLLGFNTGSGLVEWESELPEPPLQVTWNENESTWIAQSIDSKRYYMIDPTKGTVIPLEKGNTIAQENPYPGYAALGYFTSDGMTNNLFYSPVEGLMVPMEGKPAWKIPCSRVYSTTAFNPLRDVGQIYIEKEGKLFGVNLTTGVLSSPIEGPFLGFFENGVAICPNGIWYGGNQVYFGQSQVSISRNSLKVVLNDGSSCVILP